LLPLVEKLGQHWEFLGVIPAIEQAAFFRVSNLMVLPSINSTESYGLVQVESMTCGTPVVASDLPGVRVPVQMTGMGRIVPRANAEALAQAIIEMLDHPDQYRRDPSEIIRLSSPEHVAEEYEKVFMKAKGDL
jgi:glycosyltransferase involved in cell wall biosynthesis